MSDDDEDPFESLEVPEDREGDPFERLGDVGPGEESDDAEANDVEDVAAELGLSEAVLEESHRSLERFDGDVEEFTAAELGAGAVLFAATIGQAQVDADQLAAVAGAGTDHVTAAMHSIVVSLCLSLVRGDIAYEDCAWTTELLQSELTPSLGDSETGRAIAIAKAYTAGREGQYVDDQTLDVLAGE